MLLIFRFGAFVMLIGQCAAAWRILLVHFSRISEHGPSPHLDLDAPDTAPFAGN
jgi:hypothetical protein